MKKLKPPKKWKILSPDYQVARIKNKKSNIIAYINKDGCVICRNETFYYEPIPHNVYKFLWKFYKKWKKENDNSKCNNTSTYS
jgi:hypothetical protein